MLAVHSSVGRSGAWRNIGIRADDGAVGQLALDPCVDFGGGHERHPLFLLVARVVCRQALGSPLLGARCGRVIALAGPERVVDIHACMHVYMPKSDASLAANPAMCVYLYVHTRARAHPHTHTHTHTGPTPSADPTRRMRKTLAGALTNSPCLLHINSAVVWLHLINKRVSPARLVLIRIVFSLCVLFVLAKTYGCACVFVDSLQDSLKIVPLPWRFWREL